jgi:hypothetical protein
VAVRQRRSTPASTTRREEEKDRGKNLNEAFSCEKLGLQQLLVQAVTQFQPPCPFFFALDDLKESDDDNFTCRSPSRGENPDSTARRDH